MVHVLLKPGLENFVLLIKETITGEELMAFVNGPQSSGEPGQTPAEV